jgi:uncharacterized protein (TIGR02453 family)
MKLEQTFDFLRRLKENNNRDWFNENKSLYTGALREFEVFVDTLIKHISDFDEKIMTTSVKDSTFRIYRDTRFSKDKTPYKTHFGAYIAPEGRKSGIAGYYIHVEPGGCFVAGGLYRPPTKELNSIRRRISKNFPEFLEIISNPDFVRKFGLITDTEKLKTTPRGFSAEDEAIEYLRLTNLIAVADVKEAVFEEKEPAETVSGYFETLSEFVEYLRPESW